MQQDELDRDLTAYYASEAQAGVRSEQGEFRRGLRDRFANLIRADETDRGQVAKDIGSGARRGTQIVDVGAGPGLDTVLWQADGFGAIGVDLVEANAQKMSARGVDGVVASLYGLPFASGTFDALWTMSTFVHVPHDRFDAAMTEMMRVVRHGSLLGIGTWGGLDFEGTTAFGAIRPYRYFSLAAHDRWQAMLARHGEVLTFETHRPELHHEWEYQFAVVRRVRR